MFCGKVFWNLEQDEASRKPSTWIANSFSKLPQEVVAGPGELQSF